MTAFSVIQSVLHAEEELVEHLISVNRRRWPPLCSRFVQDLAPLLREDPALAVAVVLNLIHRIRKLSGGCVLPNQHSLEHLVRRRYALRQEEMFADIARDLARWLAYDDPDVRLSDVQRYVDTNLSERLTTDRVARRFGYSKRQLMELFRTKTGTTMRQYVTRQRMSRARSLIQQGEKIESVMLQVGYHNKTHFYRAFERYNGTKPLQARSPENSQYEPLPVPA